MAESWPCCARYGGHRFRCRHRQVEIRLQPKLQIKLYRKLTVPSAAPIQLPLRAVDRRAAAQYPRLELFAGGTMPRPVFSTLDTGPGLRGWDASLGLNVTSWIGVVVDGGQYFGTSKFGPLLPQPFPTVSVASNLLRLQRLMLRREYNILFGLQFARRKYGRWTPIGEAMYGHEGTRGVATPRDARAALVAEVSSGRAIVAGGGIERTINPRLALRIKADYLQTDRFQTRYRIISASRSDSSSATCTRRSAH